MFCPKCGTNQPEDARFCGICGFDLEKASHRDDAVPPPNPKPKRRFPKVAAICAGALVAIVGVAVAAMLLLPEGSMPVPNIIGPAELSDDEILASIDDAALTESVAPPTLYVENDDFKVTSKTVDSVEDVDAGDRHEKAARVTVVCENTPFRYTSSWMLKFVWEDEGWKLLDSYENLEGSYEAINGVSDNVSSDTVLEMMTMIDNNYPYANSDGDEVLLTDLYAQNFQCTVVENNTAPSGGEMKVEISASSGMESYSGTITAQFEWDGYDWYLSDCQVDEGAYAVSREGLIGTWQGTFVESSVTKGTCYGGRANPVVITFKSVSEDGLTAVVDISFLLHNHKGLDNPVDAHESDSYETLKDVLINLDPDVETIYEGEKTITSIAESTYKVQLGYRDDGTLYVTLVTHYDGGKWGEYGSQTDYYDLAKQEEAEA